MGEVVTTGSTVLGRAGLCALVALAALMSARDAGATVVFQSDRCTDSEQRTQHPDCHEAIWRVGDDGIGLRRLTPPDGTPHSPSFAAGGSLVAFWRAAPAEATLTTGSDELWLVGSDGTRARRVAGSFELGLDYLNELDASPVGRAVVLSGPPRLTNAGSDLFVAGFDGTPARRLTNSPGTHEIEPKVSPDGRKVAFYRGDAGPNPNARGSGVYSVPLRGGRAVPLVVGSIPGSNEDTYVRTLAWSPDGRALAFSSGGLIYSITADGRNLRRVADIATGGSDLAWTGSRSSGFLISEPDLPLPGDERRPSPLFGPGPAPGGRPLYTLRLGSRGSYARPFTPPVTGRAAQERFAGDRAPDWIGRRALPSPADLVPPALDLVDGADGRFAGHSRGRRRGRRGSVSARRLRFLAVDPSGVRRVEGALGKRAGRRGRRQLCRFSTARRATGRRPCDRPLFVRLRSARSLLGMTRALGRGSYVVRLRASDRRGNRTGRTRALSLRIGR
jgi:hypothetical protein